MPRYEIASDESEVWIEATSSVHPIHSHTTGLRGWLDLTFGADGSLDTDRAVGAVIEMPVDLLSSGNPLETRELRRRIEARRYPTIEGRLDALEALDQADTYLARGVVTFRGQSCSQEGELRIAQQSPGGLAISGESTFDIRDFGMEPPRILMLRVHPIVTVRVAVVAVLPGPADDAP
jgi:hypothetical protein